MQKYLPYCIYSYSRSFAVLTSTTPSSESSIVVNKNAVTTPFIHLQNTLQYDNLIMGYSGSTPSRVQSPMLLLSDQYQSLDKIARLPSFIYILRYSILKIFTTRKVCSGPRRKKSSDQLSSYRTCSTVYGASLA